MRKLKLYLDTSVIGNLDAWDAPDKQADTLALWDDIIAGEYDVFLSYVVFEELARCPEEKKSTLMDYLAQIEYERIESHEDIFSLADEFIRLGVLKQKCHDDAQHIAASMVAGCDILVSWNFRHMVNYKMIDGVRIVSAITKYRDVSICTPTMLFGGDNDDS